MSLFQMARLLTAPMVEKVAVRSVFLHHPTMFTRIQTRLFRCLKSVDQTLGPFRALVGPNASGKTTFLDVIGFLGDLVRNRGDVLETVRVRSSSFEKLLWMNEGNSFQLAVEAEIPEGVRRVMAENKQRFRRVRYEVEVGLERGTNEIGLNYETLWLKEAAAEKRFVQRAFFPAPQEEKSSLISRSQKGQNAALTKKPGGNDNYYPEGRDSYTPSFKLGRRKSALANLPADTENALETAIQWPVGKNVREWCRSQGFVFEQNGKPRRPKEALEAALKVPGLPRSSALYQRIAQSISLQYCGDEAFVRLREQLADWFPPAVSVLP